MPKQAPGHFFLADPTADGVVDRWQSNRGVHGLAEWSTWSSPPGRADGALSDCVITHNLRLHTHHNLHGRGGQCVVWTTIN